MNPHCWLNYFKSQRFTVWLRSIIIVLFLIPPLADANPDDHLKELLNQAEKIKLWKKTEWLKLLHYYEDGVPSGYTSHVDDERYFNADTGKSDPKIELLATLSAIFRIDTSGNDHPQCRFVARIAWLTQQLEINRSLLPKVKCSDYVEWRTMVQAQQVTLVFPAYHLNSPSSMFGHTLLRLDPTQTKGWSKWLSFAVNFGAEIDNQENSLFYAFKGLTGGYPGNFIVTPYFEKIKEYNRIENRDIWEYPLNLTPDEVNRLITHLWELKEINFDYYFFDENCSFRLLELLEVARPGVNLTDQFDLTAIPVDTVRAIEQTGMIKSVEYRPSQATELENLISDIPDEDRIYIKDIAQNPRLAESTTFNALSQPRRQNIINAAYKYLRFENAGKTRDASVAKASYQLLTLLNRYPAATESNNIPTPVPPEKSHLSRRATIGIGERWNERYTELGFKFAYHSIEDNERGFLRGAQINMGNLQVRIDDNGDTKLGRFDVVDIFSLTPRTNFFKPLSWKILTGFERQPTDNNDELVAHVSGGAGFSYRIRQNGLSYALVTSRLEANPEFSQPIEAALGLSTGAIYHFASSTVHIEANAQRFTNGVQRYKLEYVQNFVISRNRAVNLIANREKFSDRYLSDLTLKYQFYF